MADLNPMVPGDVPYPQYSVTQTLELAGGDTFVKGALYVPDGNGRLVDGDPSNFDNGLYQAAADADNSLASDGENSLQVLSPRTRMLFIADDADLVVGSDVIFTTNETDGAHIDIGAKTSILYVGKVFEIYTRNSDSTRKYVSATGDRVIVETVLI